MIKWIKKFLFPDVPPEANNRNERRATLRDWEKRQIRARGSTKRVKHL